MKKEPKVDEILINCERCGNLIYFGPNNKKDINNASCGVCNTYMVDYWEKEKTRRKLYSQLKKQEVLPIKKRCNICGSFFKIAHNTQTKCEKCRKKGLHNSLKLAI